MRESGATSDIVTLIYMYQYKNINSYYLIAFSTSLFEIRLLKVETQALYVIVKYSTSMQALTTFSHSVSLNPYLLLLNRMHTSKIRKLT